MQGMWLFLRVLFSENWKLALVLLNYWKRSVRVLLNLFSGCILLNLSCKAPIINLSDVFVFLLICASISICAAFWAWLIRWRALLLNSANAFFPLNRGKKKYFCDGTRLNLPVQITSLQNTLLAKALTNTVASLHLTAYEQFDMKIQTRLGFIWRIPNYANNSVFSICEPLKKWYWKQKFYQCALTWGIVGKIFTCYQQESPCLRWVFQTWERCWQLCCCCPCEMRIFFSDALNLSFVIKMQCARN